MNFFDFLNASVTPYHTVDSLKKIICSNDAFLFERQGALVAVKLPVLPSANSKFRIALAHTDFPTLKISPNPSVFSAGVQTLHSEIYGSPIYVSWLDRALGYAGLLAYKVNDNLQTKLFRSKTLCYIPELAVHLNRSVNQDGLKINPETDLNAMWCANESFKFIDALKRELPKNAELLDFDVQMFDASPAQFGGFDNEWIFSGRLDNLSSCHAIATAFANVKQAQNDFIVACFFNNEEVGSITSEGACGNLLHMVLNDLWQKNIATKDLEKSLEKSFALSVDMAHAMHPNFGWKHEQNHAPILGNGIVLKVNAQKRYASDVLSCAKFKMLCEKANVKYQTFIMRSDMPCGSTVGPTISATFGIPTVDIGEAMLAMHSAREIIAANDHENMTTLVNEFFKD